LQKYIGQAEKDRHVYLKALAAFEAGKKTSVSRLCFSDGFVVCFVIGESDSVV